MQRKLADKVAANGFLVVVPDFFYGDPLDLGIPNADWQSWLKVHGTVSFWFQSLIQKSTIRIEV